MTPLPPIAEATPPRWMRVIQVLVDIPLIGQFLSLLLVFGPGFLVIGALVGFATFAAAAMGGFEPRAHEAFFDLMKTPGRLTFGVLGFAYALVGLITLWWALKFRHAGAPLRFAFIPFVWICYLIIAVGMFAGIAGVAAPGWAVTLPFFDDFAQPEG